MKTLCIDIETYCDLDLKKCGVYRYAESKNFEILLFSYAVDDGKVEVIDIAQGEKIPEEIIDVLVDEDVIKWAFNANFERVCLSSFIRKFYPHKLNQGSGRQNVYISSKSWRCTMVWSAYMGLTLSLESVGAILGLDKQKLKEGKELIKYFSVPSKPSKNNNFRSRNMPYHATDKWELFKEYNKRDVEVEKSIKDKFKNYPVPECIWEEYELDQEINDRGILVDMSFVNKAIELDETMRDEIIKKLKAITGLKNPNSVGQMKSWLKEHGLVLESLGKNTVEMYIDDAKEPVKTVLDLRQKIAKSSVKKYKAMKNSACMDNRARGMFMFYGANRTGRYAGRIIQLQNLPRNYIEDIENTRKLVRCSPYNFLKDKYNVLDTLSQLIRTSFIPRHGYKFIVADFSSIEARVIAWLAGEKWRMDSFSRGEDIYCRSASMMYGVNVEKNGENSHLRQKGKIAELACGYGGSIGAIKSIDSKNTSTEDELKEIVDNWRRANPNIVKLWWDVDRAVKNAIKMKIPVNLYEIEFNYKSGMLFIKLPSNRVLSYVKPRLEVNKFGSEGITYEGIGVTKKWERIESYGAKFVENIVQAISRDILMHAIKTLREYNIVAHVHDEIIIECEPHISVEEICKKMSITPSWAKGLVLSSEGFECQFYRKD